MKTFDLKGTARTDLGKKGTREIRKAGNVPCNLYGVKKDENGKPVATPFTVTNDSLRNLVYTPHIYAVKLDIDGQNCMAIMKEIQFHPTTDAPLHVDFYEVNDQKPITIGIPVKLVGLAQGVRDGGRMNLSIRKIEVTAPYQQIPEHLDVDVTALQIGKSIKVGQLSYEGLELATGKDVIVCSIKMTRAAMSAAASSDK